VKELIFKKVLKVLYNKKSSLLYNYYYYLDITDNINDMYNKIYEINKNTYEKEKEKNTKRKIIIIKKQLQKFIIRNHIYSDKIIINNQEDPFTFDNIKDINVNERFIYNDGNNYYCFKAIELHYFIVEKNNNWNPYTKKQFEPHILKNLNVFIKYFNLINNKTNEKYNWKTINQAYTEVSQSLEKIGFYNNTEWFLKITSAQIKNIIRLFKIISANNENNINYLNDINENTIFFDFAREIIKLFEDGNSHFLLCCNFMKALSLYSNDFYNNLPDWMADIESPIIVNNYFNRLNYNYNTDIIYLINIIEN
jgi:virulence-associated protein VapD